jgi:hypothetical protein
MVDRGEKGSGSLMTSFVRHRDTPKRRHKGYENEKTLGG